jgi:GT2 family glycosyltransferase
MNGPPLSRGVFRNMMDVSIIIVSWNTRDYLLNCIRSLMRTEASSCEVWVVDNGSKDGSASEVKQSFPRVRLIENDSNLGFAKAVNQGLQVFSGRYALLLNPDTEVKEGAIEKLLGFMEDHPEAGVAGVQLLNSDGTKQNSIANFPSLTTELFNKRTLRWLFPERFPGKERSYAGAIEVDSVIGACMMVRRKAADDVGFLDEAYFLFLEETDWCFRMKKAGWKVYHVPQAEIIHFQGRSVAQDKRRSKVEYDRSRYRFFKKNWGKAQWFTLLIGRMFGLLLGLIYWTVMCSFTFFEHEKWRRKLSVVAYLLEWHLKGCPEGMGLRKESTKFQAPNPK